MKSKLPILLVCTLAITRANGQMIDTLAIYDTAIVTVDNKGFDVQWEHSYDSISWWQITGETNDTLEYYFEGPVHLRAQLTKAECSTSYSDVLSLYLPDSITCFGEVFIIVESMPRFQGEYHSAFNGYIAKNIEWTQEESFFHANEYKCYINFIVNREGWVEQAKVVRGETDFLNERAMQVVQNSPQWTPGTQRGSRVCVEFTFPVNFTSENIKSK